MRRLALAATAASLAMTLAATVLAISLLNATDTVAALSEVIFPVVALAIMRAYPRNTVAWAFMVSGLLNSLNHLGEAVALVGLQHSWSPSVTGFGAWLTSWTWFPALFMLITIGLSHFPDGRAVSPRWRWLDLTSVTLMAITGLSFGLGAWGLPAAEMLASATPTPTGWRHVVFDLGFLGFTATVPCVLASIASLVVRWRRSTGIGRLQIRWVAAAGALAVVAEIGLDAAGTAGLHYGDEIQTIVETIVFRLIVIATGFAILRYRLYEIDRIVSRTVGYAVVTALLVGVYIGVAALAATVIPHRYGSVGVAAATLSVALLFVPLRHRTQHLVDRRFDRARYDGARTVESFATAIRNELSESELTSELVHTVQRALSPASASVWLVERGSGPHA
jgi:hypothetical protein